MKKFLSGLFLLLIFLSIVLSMSGWYFGMLAEQSFRHYLTNNNEDIAGEKPFQYELLSYQKTVLGAKAKISVTSNAIYFDECMGEIKLVATLLNGPLFMTKSGISIGRSRWYIALDDAALEEEERNNIRAVFPDVLPHLIIRTDFKGRVKYVSSLITKVAQVTVSGVYNAKNKTNQGNVILNQFSYYQHPKKISADRINIRYTKQKPINSTYHENIAFVTIPSLRLDMGQGEEAIDLMIQATTNIIRKSNDVSGFLDLTLKKMNRVELPITKADLSIKFNGLSSAGFLHFSEKKAELDNLRQQAQWSLQEIGEYPEGQDQIWQLYDAIDRRTKQLQPILLNGLFKQNSLIKFKARSYNLTGKSELNGTLRNIDTQRQKSIKNRRGGFDRLIWSILQGEANIKLDKELYSYLKRATPIIKSNFKLTLKDSKLLMQ